jgi:indolepyruvate decarboxylase
MTVGRYLVRRLEEVGVRHVFGVPGDYVLAFMDCLVASPKLKLVTTCNELNAGYAADAYARLNRAGALCVTYAVGGLSALNAVAGAYAERVPLVVISGAPYRAAKERHLLLHHTFGDYDAQRKIYAHVTEAAVSLDDPARAPQRIDETLATCLRHSRPVYLELPSDVVGLPCTAPKPFAFRSEPTSETAALAEAVEETLAMIGRAKRPLILAGVEIHRYRLRRALETLLRRSGFPIATTLLAKSLISEQHPQYVGVYAGGLSKERVRRTVERSDCLLSLGAIMTDVNLGIYTANLDERTFIAANGDRVAIKHHHYGGVYLGHYIKALAKGVGRLKLRRQRIVPATRSLLKPYAPRPRARITVQRFFERMNHFLKPEHVVLADAGDCFLCAADLVMREKIGFVCQAFYCSIGFTLPASLGVKLAVPDRRPVVFMGDGAFQMTGQEFSTLIRERLNPIVFVMNNRGYAIERAIHDGPYNDLQPWIYHRWPEVLGGAPHYEVRTEGDLETVLSALARLKDAPSLVEVHIDPQDRSEGLERLGRIVAKTYRL